MTDRLPHGFPDLEGFGRALAPSDARHRAIRALYSILASMRVDDPLEAREIAFERLGKWIRDTSRAPTVETASLHDGPEGKRLRMLALAMRSFPPVRLHLGRMVQVMLRDKSAQSFLAKMGVPGDRGFSGEIVDRLSARLIPEPIDEQELAQLLGHMFPRARDAEWLRQLPADLVVELARLLRDPTGVSERHVGTDETPLAPRVTSAPELPLGAAPSLHEIPAHPPSRPPPASRQFNVWAPLRTATLDAVLLLAARVSAAGLSDVIRARSPQVALRESPFFKLPRSIDALLAVPRQEVEVADAWAADCRSLLEACREAVRAVHDRLEDTGVSVDVVYRLELITKGLDRIELLLRRLLPQSEEERYVGATRLMAMLLEARSHDRSLRDTVASGVRLLARKVIERAGTTGEHYITVTPGEWLKMLASGAGGGLLTTGTTALKFIIGWGKLPLFQAGFLAGANYAGSFLLMQFLGFTLATKQPSVIAAALAGALRERDDVRELVTLIARVTRSQLAAAIGNVLFVAVGCVAFHWYYASTNGGRAFLDRETASYVLHSFHPLESGTVPYAALTGVLLWSSSLAAGWLENWAVYRRIPEAIAEHRLRRYLGQGIMSWLSKLFARNIAGIGGNLAIGFLLGMTPVIGKFLGLPLDIRHITLSTGAVTLAWLAEPAAERHLDAYLGASAGIALMGLMNFGVSFVLALAVALRAREVGFRGWLTLGGALLKAFVKSPLRFFLPPRDDGGSKPAPHH